MSLRRRTLLGGLAGTAALAGMGGVAAVVHADSAQAFADRLVADLAASVPDALADSTAFTVTRFEQATDPRTGQVTLTALVRMDWHPGLRQRRFDGTAGDPDTAYATLRDAARGGFAPALAGGRG